MTPMTFSNSMSCLLRVLAAVFAINLLCQLFGIPVITPLLTAFTSIGFGATVCAKVMDELGDKMAERRRAKMEQRHAKLEQSDNVWTESHQKNLWLHQPNPFRKHRSEQEKIVVDKVLKRVAENYARRKDAKQSTVKS